MIKYSKVSFSLILTLICHSQWELTQGALSGWSDSPTQYHIQTDEGTERFFKYQTYNGQYRKERRMDDGTVIGSYGWVDPAGFLRMTDYVADNKGYRVVNSRMEYVGVKPEPTSEITEKETYQRSTKQGNRVTRHRLPDMFRRASSELSVKTHKNPKSAEVEPTSRVVPATIIPTSSLSVPVTNPSSEDSETVKSQKRRIVKVYKRRPKIDQNNITSPSGNGTDKRPFVVQVTKNTKTGRQDVFKAYATPIRRGSGFIYKIPNQYHKEEIEPRTGNQVGSFGYVDPFGIRRVIHYNAGKDGFKHEVDFKYVGKDDESSR